MLALSMAWSVLLHGKTVLSLATSIPAAAFTTSHAWCFDHIRRMLVGELPFATVTDRLGFSDSLGVAFIAWGPAVLVAPVGQLFGPVVAINVASLLAPPLAALATYAWARSRELPVTAAALAGALFALAPPLTSALANGQLCKANVWAVPLCLASIDLAARRPWLAPVSGLVLAVSLFSEPTFAVIASLLAVPYGLERVWSSPRRLTALIGVALAGASWLPALFFAQGYYTSGIGSAFAPAGSVDSGHAAATLAGSVPLLELLLGRDYAVTTQLTTHVGYAGVVLLLGTLYAAAHHPLARVGAGLVAIGAVLALGEYAVDGGAHLRVSGKLIELPARWLADAGFPFARSGQYVRWLVPAWLGGALALGALHALKPRAAWVLSALLALDGLRATAGLWPLASFEVVGARDFATLSSVDPGLRTLDMPGLGGNFGSGLAQMRAALHGHPSDAVVRAGHRWPNAPQAVRDVVTAIERHDSDRARGLLQRERVGLLTWVPPATAEGPALDDLVATLGEPSREGEVYYWRLSAGQPGRAVPR